MIDSKDILKKAVLLKLSLSDRAKTIQQLHGALGLAVSGMAPDLKPDRIETMQCSLDRATALQAREGLIYATLRWVLGGSSDIDETNLDLLQ